MSTVLQISDPHFGTELSHVSNALIRLAHSLAPDLLIVSGDITQRAQPEQFDAARQFIDKLGISRQLVIPGNHDIPLLDIASRVFFPYSRYQRVFGQDLEPVYQSEDMLIITLNTTRRYRHVYGEVSRYQIDRVEKLLRDASRQQLRIVVTHQPVSVLRQEDEEDLLYRHAGAIRRWTAAGVDLILGGHIHLPYVSALHEQYPDLSRQAWAVQAGTCISSRIRHEAGNSVNLIRFKGLVEHPSRLHTVDNSTRCCEIQRWDYQTGTDSFEKVAVYDLLCDTSPGDTHTKDAHGDKHSSTNPISEKREDASA